MYSEESAHLQHICEVLLYLKKYLAENPVRYAPAMTAYITLLYGIIPNINVECQHDSGCQVSTRQPVGGILDTLEVFDEAFECLDLEMDMELPAYEYPPTYEI